MRNNYHCILLDHIKSNCLLVSFILFPLVTFAQLGTQSPSITTGVTFEWSDTQSTNSDAATISKVTVSGTEYNSFVVPSSYELTRLGPNGDAANRIRENGTETVNSSLPRAAWDITALETFQDKNLNHYFTSDSNGANLCGNFTSAESTSATAQRQSLIYSPAIPSNDDGILAITERGGNNCLYVEVYGYPAGTTGGTEQRLGDTFVRTTGNYTSCGTIAAPGAGSDYWRSDRCNDNGQAIAIALFYLDDLAPTGSLITRIEFVGATTDHGDGKFFLLQKYAVDQQLIECLDNTYQGDLNVLNNAPANSTYTINPPTSGGGSFSHNSDGTYTYTPVPGFTGDIEFDYELCLPAPNNTVCETGSVKLSYVNLPPEPAYNIVCNSTNNYTLEVTYPNGDYEYSLDNGATFQASTTFDNLTEGSYNLIVKSANTSCEKQNNSNPIILKDLAVIASVTNVTCKQDTTGEIDITVSGGKTSYSYSWTGPNAFTATTEDISNLEIGTYEVTVTDANGCEIIEDFTITAPADTTPPTMVCPSDITLSTDSGLCTASSVNLGIPVTNDNCAVLSVTHDAVEPFALGSTTVTWTVEDNSGNKITCTQFVIVEDNTPASGTAPSGNSAIDACADETTIDTILTTANDITNIETAYTDICGTVSVTFKNQTLTGNDCSWSLERIYTISDGNATNDFDISITHTGGDQTAPTLTGTAPKGITNADACSADAQTNYPFNATTIEASYSDNCNGVTVNLTGTSQTGDDCGWTLVYTYEVLDDCGNKLENQTITYTGNDQTAPTLTGATPTGVTNADVCSTDAQTTYPFNATTIAPSYSDNCNNVTVNLTNTTQTGNNCSWTLIYTFEVVDDCGNKLENQTITYTGSDQTNPTIDTTNKQDIEIVCGIGNTQQQLNDWLNNNAGATASDNCSNITWTNNYGSDTSIKCIGDTGIEVIFTATDDCGNSTTTTATYLIKDDVPPTISTPASNITVQCDGAGNIAQLNDWLNTNGGAIATEDCSTINWSHDFTGLSDDCGETGSATVIFTATDACGNTSTTSATFTIEDTTNPTWTNEPTDLTVECDGTADPSGAFANWLASFSGSDTCGTAVVTNNSTGLSNLCGATGTETVTFTLTDDCGNFIIKEATFTIEDTTNPTWTNEPTDLTVECDGTTDPNGAFANWLASFSGSDTCGTAIVTNNSAGLSDLCGATGTETVTFTLTDDCGNFIIKEATFTIEDTTAPLIDAKNLFDIEIICGKGDTEQDLTDWLNNNAGATATDSCSNITWTNNYGGDNSVKCKLGKGIEVVFTAQDECGNTSDISAYYHIRDITPPTVVTPASDMTVECDGSGNLSELNSWLSTNGGAFATEDCSTIIWSNDFTGLSDDCGETGSATVTFTATDGCGNFSTSTATFTIEDTTAPTLPTAPSDITYECLSDVPTAGSLTATDQCSGIINVIGVDDVDNTNPCFVIIKRTWTFTDDCANTASTTQTITVTDTTAPVLDLPVNVTAECSADLSPIIFGSATATDNCDPNPIVTYNDVKTDGPCSGTYTITRTWTATDSCGNTVSADQIISTSDTTAPTFDQTTLPANMVVECDNVPSAEILTASDNCGSASVSVSEIRIDGSCPSNYTIERTYTATDECGLTNTHIQTITVQDTQAPQFVEVLPPTTLVVECDAVPSPETLTATDICGSATVTVSDVRTNDNCKYNYSIARTWTAKDECGLTTTHIQIITVQDTTAPVFVESLPGDITVECNAIPTPQNLTATDNCGDATVSFNDVKIIDNCANNYIIERTYTAKDECGLTSTHTQIIKVQDTKAPEPSTSFETILDVSCTTIPDIPNVTFTDNCSANITIDFEETSSFDEDVHEDYQIIRTWIVKDECSNEATYTQTLNVRLDEIYTEFVAPDACFDEGIVNLHDFIPNDLNKKGHWEILEGESAATLVGNIFDPTKIKMSEDFRPGTDGILYRFRYTTTDNGCLSVNEIVMNLHADCVVLPCGEDEIKISTALTPNGDGYNDTFDIKGIDLCGFVAEVKVFNRWGALVYESNDYTLGSIETSGVRGDWDGTSPNSSLGSNGRLPSGTYYYIINLKNSGISPLTGSVYIGTN